MDDSSGYVGLFDDILYGDNNNDNNDNNDDDNDNNDVDNNNNDDDNNNNDDENTDVIKILVREARRGIPVCESSTQALELTVNHFYNLKPALDGFLKLLVFGGGEDESFTAMLKRAVQALSVTRASSGGDGAEDSGLLLASLQQEVSLLTSLSSVIVNFIQNFLNSLLDSEIESECLLRLEHASDSEYLSSAVGDIQNLVVALRSRLELVESAINVIRALSTTPAFVGGVGGVAGTTDALHASSFSGAVVDGADAGIALGGGGGDEGAGGGTRKMTGDQKLLFSMQTLEKRLTKLRARKLEGRLYFPKIYRYTDSINQPQTLHTLIWEGKAPGNNPETISSFVLDSFYCSALSKTYAEEEHLAILAQRERVSHAFKELFNYTIDNSASSLLRLAPMPGVLPHKPILHCFSFLDGVVTCENHSMRLITHQEAEMKGLQAIKFFETTAKDKLEILAAGQTLETPCLSKILDAQDLPVQRRKLLMAFLFARPLFPPKSYDLGLGDNYDLFVAIKGPGGVGKSSIVECLSALVGHDNCAILESKSSEGHAFHELLRPGSTSFYPIALATDIDNPNWSQEMLQKMASGERVSINPKGRDAVSGLGPKLIIVTNGSLRMSDDGGQISRRMFCEVFPNRLEERGVTPNALFQRRMCSAGADGELASIVLNSLSFYFDIVKKVGPSRPQQYYYNLIGASQPLVRNNIAMIGTSKIEARQEAMGFHYIIDFFLAHLENRYKRPVQADEAFFPGCSLVLALGKPGRHAIPKAVLVRLWDEYVTLRSQRSFCFEEISHQEINRVLTIFKIKIGGRRTFSYDNNSSFYDDFGCEGLSLVDDCGEDVFASTDPVTINPINHHEASATPPPEVSSQSLSPQTSPLLLPLPPPHSQSLPNVQDVLIVVFDSEAENAPTYLINEKVGYAVSSTPRVLGVAEELQSGDPTVSNFIKLYSAAPLISRLESNSTFVKNVRILEEAGVLEEKDDLTCLSNSSNTIIKILC